MNKSQAKLKKELLELGIDIATDEDWQKHRSTVYIGWSKRLTVPTEEAIALLAKHAPRVDEIDFALTEINKESAQGLVRLAGLRELRAIGCKFPADAIAELAKCPKLMELHLSLEDDPDAQFASLCQARGLRNLGLGGSQMSDEALRHIVTLQQLQQIDLSSCPKVNLGTGYLAKLPLLTNVILEGSGLADDGAKKLAAATQLRELNVCDTKITSIGIEVITSKIPLESLLATDLKLSGRGILAIARCESLKDVMLLGVPLQYDDLIALSGMPHLEVIWFTRELIPSDGEDVFKSMAPDVDCVVWLLKSSKTSSDASTLEP